MADWGVQNRIKQETKLLDAEMYAKKLQAIANNSTWYARQQKFQQNKDSRPPPRTGYDEVERELKERRRARIRQLLGREAEMYERELAAKGLAIYRDKL